MLNLFYGLELPDTYLNYLLTKCATWLFLAGFIRIFSGGIGAFAGALLMAVHPLFSMNGSRLGIFTAAIALFWWLLVIAQERRNLFYTSLPALWILLCAAAISPWIILFLPFWALKTLTFETLQGAGGAQIPRSIIWNRQLSILLKKYEKTFAPATISIFIILFLTIFLVHTGFLQNRIESSSYLHFLKPFVLLDRVWGFIYNWKSFILFTVCLGVMAWRYPLFSLMFFLCACLSLTRMFDLGGILCLWISLSGITAVMLNDIFRNSSLFKGTWKKFSGFLVFLIFALCLFQKDSFDQILNARRQYVNGFYHQCGNHQEKKGFLNQALWGIDSDNSSAECWLAFGNYHTPLPGHYLAKFHLISSGAFGSYVETVQDNGKRILARQYIVDEHENSGVFSFSPVTVDYDTTSGPITPVEHRVHYGGKGVLYFEGVETQPIS